ncbi:ATP-dependent DNA helicase [Aureococcus anophagefferens]|uniref:DNA 3'-5' helicase n=1 Tax=Aureococcus anophagefferens TaxID=44056 RepID=A0ABR1FQB0_AURAN
MRALTEEQQAAVDYRFDAPLAIVAGAGSGKTETLTRRVARAISSGARPEGVLVLTFSNKAARELRGRLAKHLGEAVAARVECATFHSFCLRLLRRFGREAGLGPDFSIFGDSAQRALVKLCCAAAGRDDDDAVERDARQVWSLIKRAKSSRLRAGDFDGRVGAIFRAYSAKLREQRAVDFDDVIDVAAGLLARDGPCRSWARGRFALGFVDEFQDTSELQLALLDGVFGLERTPLTVVGDDDQAIYSWRDAMGDAFGSFARRFPGATLLRLTRNYRSGGHVVSAARAVVAANAARVDKALWTARPDGSKLEILRVEGGPGAEARAAAREVAKLLDAGAKPRDVAVLCRSAAPALRCAENALTKLGVPCQIAGSNRFFERAPVAAALAHLRLVANELDDDACAKCLAEGCRGLGAKSVEALRRGGGPLLGACRTAAARGTLAPQQTAALRDLLARLDALYDAVASRTAAASPVRSALRLLDDVLAPPVDGGDAKKREERRTARELLEELRGVAGERERELEAAAPGLDALRHFLDTAMVAPDASEGVGDAVGTVTLCTIHKSKGLEWPHVLLLRATDGVFPARLRDAAGDAAAGSLNGSPSRLRRRDEAAHLEEERRLFHVAITRAERTFAALHATREADGNGGDAGAGASASRSPFLDLLPKAAVSQRAVGAEEDEFPRHRARAPGFAAAAAPPFAGFATAATLKDAVFDDDAAGREDEAPRAPPAAPARARPSARRTASPASAATTARSPARSGRAAPATARRRREAPEAPRSPRRPASTATARAARGEAQVSRAARVARRAAAAARAERAAPPEPPPGARRSRAAAFVSPLLRDLWSHLQGAMEKDAKPRKKRSKSPPKRPEGQKTIGSFFAKKPPPPPGDPSSQDDWF